MAFLSFYSLCRRKYETEMMLHVSKIRATLNGHPHRRPLFLETLKKGCFFVHLHLSFVSLSVPFFSFTYEKTKIVFQEGRPRCLECFGRPFLPFSVVKTSLKGHPHQRLRCFGSLEGKALAFSTVAFLSFYSWCKRK